MRISVDFQKSSQIKFNFTSSAAAAGVTTLITGGGGTDIAEPEPGDKHRGRARREEIVVSWPSVPFKEWAADRRRDRCCCLPAHAVSILSERCGIHSRPDSFLSLLGQEEGAACLSAVSTVSCCIWRGSPLEVDIVVPQE